MHHKKFRITLNGHGSILEKHTCKSVKKMTLRKETERDFFPFFFPQNFFFFWKHDSDESSVNREN